MFDTLIITKHKISDDHVQCNLMSHWRFKLKNTFLAERITKRFRRWMESGTPRPLTSQSSKRKRSFSVISIYKMPIALFPLPATWQDSCPDCTPDRYTHKEKELYFTREITARPQHGSMLHYKWVCESYLHVKVQTGQKGQWRVLLMKLLLQCRKAGHGLCRLHQLYEHCIGFNRHDLSFFGCPPQPVEVCVCIACSGRQLT